MTLSPLRSTLTRLSSPYSRRTNASNSIDPYAKQVMEEERAGQKKFQPLQFVLDLLQRGQYLTANVADEVEESFRTGRPLGDSTLQVLKAAWEGIRGTRKGDWETLLFGGKIEGSSPEAGERPGWIPGEWGDDPLIRWGGEGTSGLGEGILRPRKLIGLAANIALDPTTYISFGATKAAQQAATKYADDVVRLTLAVDPEKIIGKLPIGLAKNPDEILKFIKAGKNTKAEKVINEIYQNAFKSALRNPVGKVMEDIQPTIQKAWGKEGLEDLVSRMVPESYEKMGERAGKFFGKEVGKGIRYPGPVRQWDLLKSKFEQSKVGNKLGDAWWSVMNNGPVGSIRKALGFRNPYQQMLHIAERQAERGVHGMIDVEAKKLAQVFGKFDDDIVNKHRLLRMEASDKGQPLAEMIRQYVDPNLMGPDVGKLGVKPEDVEKIIDLDRQVSQITHQWFMDEQTATVANGLPWDTTERVSYFPQQVGRGEVAGGTLGRGGASGTGSSGFKQSKKLSIADHVDNNAEMMKWLMGDQLRAAYDALPPQEKAIQTFDDWVRKWIIDKNLSETPLDLEQALTLRAIDHSKYMGKMRMVSDFRQFGIPIDEAVKAAPQLESQLVTYGTGTSKLGLYKVNLPGFENMVFDGDVADVITKASQVVSSDDSIRQFASMFGRATSWWKGMVTMSPGFHWRNAISNNITGFLIYGPRWFTDSKKIQQSIVGTAYLLHPEKYQDLLSGAFKGETPEKFLNILRSPVGDGGLTLEEVIDSMRGMGSASARQVQEEIGKKAGTTLNPFSNKFKGFDVSRKIGDMVEGQAKVLAFLHEYSDVATKGVSVGGSVAEKLAAQKQYLQYADRQMNKWFIDYGDLTEFEQKVFKKVIPFYSWIRHNLANQISGLTLYPNMYSLIPKIRGAIKDDEDFDYSLMPDYMKNLGYYPVGKSGAGETIMRWANIPLEDINKIPILFEGNRPIPNLSLKEFATDIVANAHPIIKSAIELASGKDLFRQRDIRGMERAPQLFQYLNNSPRVVEFLDGMLRKAGFREGLRITPVKGGTELQMNGIAARMLENNMPVLKAIDMMIQTPETLAEAVSPNVETWIQKVSGKKDYYQGLNEIFQLVSQMFGWKFKGIVEEEELARKQAQMLAKAEELKREAGRGLPGYQKRREKTLAARQKRASRIFQ